MALRLRLALIGFGLQQFEPCPAPRPLENCGSREPGLRELNPAPFTEARSVWGGELRLTELRLEHYLVSDPRARAGGGRPAATARRQTRRRGQPGPLRLADVAFE